MDIEALTDVLDRAIARVAARKFASLSEGMTKEGWSSNVHQSLESLGGLQQSNPPNYNDPWIALFYLTWYQPGQIQLVRSLIDEQRKANADGQLLGDGRQALHVVDFGCGALAMRFGLVLALADALEQGEDINAIHIDSIDPNMTMVQMGVQIWNEFLGQILSSKKDDPSMNWMIAAIRTLSQPVPTVRNIKLKELNVNPQAEYWLTAIHAVYANNVEEVNSSLAKLVSTKEPDVGILTGHNHVGQGSLLRSASPFEATRFTRRTYALGPRFSSSLPEVTRWRQQLNNQMISRHRFLDGQVTWAFRSSVAWIYTKQK